MNHVFAAGVGLTAAGLVGYGAGITAAYPGRAFSVTAVIVGVTLIAIRDGGEGTG